MPLQFLFGRTSGGEPTPVVELTLADEAGRVTPPLLALLDTGADGTLVPMSILRQAGFKSSRVRRNLITGGSETPIEAVVGYEVTVRIGTLELTYVDVFGSRQMSDVILGRNVLNQLVFTYDGPRRMLDILAP